MPPTTLIYTISFNHVNKRYRLYFVVSIDEIYDIAYSIGMGRPPLNMTPTLVRFPSDVLARIDALVGDKHRAEFIREAVTAEISRRERSGPDQNKSAPARKKR